MERIKAWLNKDEAALVYTPVNRKYLTGFASSLGFLLVTKNDATLFVDGRYIIAAKQSAKNCRVELLGKIGEQLREIINKQNINKLHVEDTLSVRTVESFKKMLEGAEILTDTGLAALVEELREVKTEAEIELITKAQRIAEKAFTETLPFIKPGVSEREIAAMLEYKCKCYGSEEPSFETIVVSGKKSAMPHGVPDGKLIENGDFVTMDFGAVVEGYHSDMTRTVAVGYATDKMIEVYETVLAAMDMAKEKIADGVLCSEVDFAARDVITKKGYGEYFTHSTGHSVGLEIHESPSLALKCEKKLKIGNVVTDEPGIYIENEFGVRIEDMVVVTKNGGKTITNCKKSLIIL